MSSHIYKDSGSGIRLEGIVPNPKLKLMDQVREVLRLKHYAIRTERSYCDWIRRYIRFHKMQAREDLCCGESKIEMFLSDLKEKITWGGHVRGNPLHLTPYD